MKNKFKNILLFLMISPMWFSLLAKENSIALPEKTELVGQSSREEKNSVRPHDYLISTYEYRSHLAKQDISDFYRKFFSSQGFREDLKMSKGNYIVFNKLPLRSATLIFFPEKESGAMTYNLETREVIKISVLPWVNFRQTALDFMPVYDQATQFFYNDYFKPAWIGIAYLTRSSPETVKSFYSDKMPSFGWKLSETNYNSGTYSFSQWVKIIDPFGQEIPIYQQMGYEENTPPLTINGLQLVFSRGNKKCSITIYKFEDIIAKAKGTAWDTSAMEKYGDTVIAVCYYETK